MNFTLGIQYPDVLFFKIYLYTFFLGSPYLFDIYTGRIIQLQNLPQNHLPDLEDARDIVKSGDYELMNILYDDTSQTPPL